MLYYIFLSFSLFICQENIPRNTSSVTVYPCKSGSKFTLIDANLALDLLANNNKNSKDVCYLKNSFYKYANSNQTSPNPLESDKNTNNTDSSPLPNDNNGLGKIIDKLPLPTGKNDSGLGLPKIVPSIPSVIPSLPVIGGGSR